MWIKGLIALLLAVNYMLLYNKLYFMVDCAFVVILGIFSLLDTGDKYSFYMAKPMLDTFYLLLIFTSIRTLNRLELRHILSRNVAVKGKLFALTCLFTAALLWYARAVLPAPLMLSSMTTLHSNLKNIGTALEMYSTDHKGLYPKKLDELTPDYLKQIPPLGYWTDSRSQKYYEEKYGGSFSYSYELDNSALRYTITVGLPGNDARRHLIRYTSEDGLLD